MTFLIADTSDSLAGLTGDEQKAVKIAAFDLQMDPSAPGLSFHKENALHARIDISGSKMISSFVTRE